MSSAYSDMKTISDAVEVMSTLGQLQLESEVPDGLNSTSRRYTAIESAQRHSTPSMPGLP